MLYTTSCGERRIRVHNLAIPVETVIQNVFDSVNIDVLCNILAKQALEARKQSLCRLTLTGIQFANRSVFHASRNSRAGKSFLELLCLLPCIMPANVDIFWACVFVLDDRLFADFT